jgi:hypothetical protein
MERHKFLIQLSTRNETFPRGFPVGPLSRVIVQALKIVIYIRSTLAKVIETSPAEWQLPAASISRPAALSAAVLVEEAECNNNSASNFSAAGWGNAQMKLQR